MLHKRLASYIVMLLIIGGCGRNEVTKTVERATGIWIFRSVLDARPRMITIGLNKRLWIAYSTETGGLYKAWSGGFTGKIYTDGEQPKSSGYTYFEEPAGNPWRISAGGENRTPAYQYKGHSLKGDVVSLNYELIYDDHTIQVSETPEYVAINDSVTGFTRQFKVKGLPDGLTLSLQTQEGLQAFKNDETLISLQMPEKQLPPPAPKKLSQEQLVMELMSKSDCNTCHNKELKTIGPSYKDIARKYSGIASAAATLSEKVISGGAGNWGEVPMTPHADLPKETAKQMVDYILSLHDKPVVKKAPNKFMPVPPFAIQFTPYSPEDGYSTNAGKGIAVNVYQSPQRVYGFKTVDAITAPTASGTLNALNLANEDFGEWKENFVMQASGFININQSGKIKFRLVCDDGGKLILNEKEVLRNTGNFGGETRDTELTLTTGKHPFRLEYYQRGGGCLLSLQWQLPGAKSFEAIPPSAFTHNTADIKKPVKSAAEEMPALMTDPLNDQVHPAFTLEQARPKDFTPRVGAFDFLPDGRMVVATWDSTGGIYIVDKIQGKDTAAMKVKRIAFGLMEVLGLKVVDGVIYVLQKQELTRLVDIDNDDIIDEYQVVCNGWKVSSNFHEFAFGLLYRDGYFYGTLATAIKPGGASDPNQMPGRGSVIKISAKDGSFSFVASGLRTPNGIGVAIDDQVFICDNQGDWLPANKLVHLQPGAWYGSRAVDFAGTANKKATPPVVYLPQDEIANSPSQPALLNHGIYKNQIIYGDITHGGIKRVFAEKINGQYQGCVFRFTQGLEAGVNRLLWGPDGKLYVGGCGQKGNWAQTGKHQYGLQRLVFNNNAPFEILAVRAKPTGYEIEFTQPMQTGIALQPSDFLVKQWWYLPTAEYGGPKMDEEKLPVKNVQVLEGGRKIFIEVTGVKEEHVQYLRIDRNKIKSQQGKSLWQWETWYTMNQLPKN